MIVKTLGVVLSKVPYTDHSAVVKVFTENNGLIPFLVQGLGKSKSKAAYYQSGQLIELVFNDKQGGGLRRIKEVQLHRENPIMLSIPAQQLCFFYTELLSLSLEDSHSDAALFEYIKDKICSLGNEVSQKYAPIQFVLGLCEQLGYQIDADVHFPHLQGVKFQLQEISAGRDPELDRSMRRHLLNRLVDVLRLLAFPERSVRSLEVIDELFL